jgi:hypothetical protein
MFRERDARQIAALIASTFQFGRHCRDPIECLVEICDRRCVRQPHVMRRAEIVAANQGDVCLIENQIGE